MNRPLPLAAASDPSRESFDTLLDGLVRNPFSIAEPQLRTAPFVFASPHSGRVYPPTFLAASRLDPLVLRRSEDAFVDELFASAPHEGAVLLMAHFPRAYLDVNRAEGELDPGMFDGQIGYRPAGRSARVTAGLGVIPRVVRDGVEIYRHTLPAGEAAFRLETFYRPYHSALAQLVADTQARFGVAVVIDCHSMPPLARGYDVVVGDCHGEAAAPELSAFIQKCFRNLGFSVGRNSPYAGGHTTGLYGKPTAGLHAIQIEINRGLYLDEKRIEKTVGFGECRNLVAQFIAELISKADGLLPVRA
jgi:N-formylglutamate deformylase